MKVFFKKSFSVFTAVITAIVLMTSVFSGYAAEYRNGDTNLDGKVDVYDVVNICKHILKKPLLSGDNFNQSDYNKDGKVDIYDAVFLSKRILCENKINEVVALINLKRKKTGVKPLTINQSLVDASIKRASELPKKFSGDLRPDNSSFKTVLNEYGIKYETCANCVAALPETPKNLYEEMLKKESVIKKLTDKKYTEIGVGYCAYNDIYKNYWAILLI